MKSKQNIIAVVQCTSADFYASTDENDYCINILKKSGLFKSIVLLMPDLPESYHAKKYANKWGVDIYYGAVWDVSHRIYNGLKKYNPTIVVRVILKRFYLDIELIKEQIEIVTGGADIALLSKDVNYEVSADVFSFDALKKVISNVDLEENEYTKNAYKFAPWTMMDELEMFNSIEVQYSELWNKELVKEIKEKLKKFLGEEENKNHISISNPSSRYTNLIKYLKKEDTVLDIASGQGTGSFMLSKYVKYIVGIDYNKNYIKNAKKLYVKNNLKYYYGTDKSIENIGIEYDVVISLHTMEHVENDLLFLKNIYKSILPGGLLLLEVPRLMKYPLGEPLYYFHLREYTKNELELKIKKAGYVIQKSFGCNRHSYTNIDLAREGFFYVCKKIN